MASAGIMGQSSRTKGQASMRRHGGRCGTTGSWILSLAVFVGACAQARSDTIELRGGGEIQGKVIIDPKKPDTVQVLLLKGRNLLTFQSKLILKVIPKASPLDEYLARKQQLSATAPAELELGLWCERNGLTDLARAHYEAAIEHDKMFEPARKKLGHVQHGSQWLSPDELRQVQGALGHRGGAGEERRIGTARCGSNDMGAADQAAPTGDGRRLGRSSARGRSRADADSRSRGGPSARQGSRQRRGAFADPPGPRAGCDSGQRVEPGPGGHAPGRA